MILDIKDMITTNLDLSNYVAKAELYNKYYEKEQKIEITEDNLLAYFKEKEKTEVEILKEQINAQDEALQSVLFDLLPSMEGDE